MDTGYSEHISGIRVVRMDRSRYFFSSVSCENICHREFSYRPERCGVHYSSGAKPDCNIAYRQ